MKEGEKCITWEKEGEGLRRAVQCRCKRAGSWAVVVSHTRHGGRETQHVRVWGTLIS